jgi:hypothetical protein
MKNRIKLVGLVAGSIGLAAALLAPTPAVADSQGYGMGPYTLCSAYPLTNGSTTTLSLSTNLPGWAAWKGEVQMMAIIAPNGTNVGSKQNFCTNLALKFNYMIGTNVTTDNPFTWTIATDQLGAYSSNFTNPVVVWTNRIQLSGLTGLQLTSATPNSTNTSGPNLTLLMQVPKQ